MDENQLSLAEQKQVYENIKDDYQKLLRIVEQKREFSLPTDIDLDAWVNSTNIR